MTSLPQPRRRRSKRELLALGLRASRLMSLLLRVPCWRGMAVFTYHRIGEPDPALYPGTLSASAEELDRQLRFMTRNFSVIDPQQFSADLLNRRDRLVMITFDDGYRDMYELAHPVLEANGVRAIMFLCTGFIDGQAQAWWDDIAWMLQRSPAAELAPGPWSREPLPLADADDRWPAMQVVTRAYWGLDSGRGEEFLNALADTTGAGRRPANPTDWITWDMARRLRAAGHAIGAHTLTHPILARTPPPQQREEISGSIDRIEAELGERPRWLAYPVGHAATFSPTTQQISREAGIEYAFSNYLGHVTADTFDRLDVRRISSEMVRMPIMLSAVLVLPQVFARAEQPPPIRR